MLTHTKFQDVDNNLLVYPMNDSRSWSKMSTSTIDVTFKKLLRVRPKTALGIRKKKRIEIAKRFALDGIKMKT